MSKSMVVPVRQYAETAHVGGIGVDEVVAGPYAVAVNRFFRLTDIFASVSAAAGPGGAIAATSSFWITTGGVGVGRVFKLHFTATGSIAISFETPLEFIGATNIYITAVATATELTRAGYLGELHYAA